MFDDYNDGCCPQCVLHDREIEMCLNRDDYWECPACQLQVSGGGGRCMILRQRGSGQFKRESVGASQHIVGAYVCAQSVDDSLTSDGKHMDESALRSFLEHQVRRSDG